MRDWTRRLRDRQLAELHEQGIDPHAELAQAAADRLLARKLPEFFRPGTPLAEHIEQGLQDPRPGDEDLPTGESRPNGNS